MERKTMQKKVPETMTLPAVTISSAGGLKFVATTNAGNEIFVEPGPVLGGSGKNPNPLDYYLAAIGGCAAIKTKIDLAALGAAPDSLQVRVDGTRSAALPQILTAIHAKFFLKGRFDNAQVAAVIDEVMTLHCPVAVMAAASAKITWEYTIEQA
jgi:putative redox protein